MSDNVDGEAFRRTLERQGLVELLEELSGNQMDSPDCPVTDFGREVREQVNGRLFKEPQETIQASDFQIGYIGVLYESLNETQFQEELLRELMSDDGGAR